MKILPQKAIEQLIPIYRDGLLEDVLPFWIKHSIDHQDGGYLFALDRDGTVIDTDKGVWLTGRFIWLLATLYNTVEQRTEWLELAKYGMDFISKYGFDDDGRMFFVLTRDGKPLRKRRYLFSEAFTTIAFAAYAKAANSAQYGERARQLFRLMIRYFTAPGLLEPKVNPQVRPIKGLAMPMILIATAQVLRDTIDDPLANEWIDRSVAEIHRDFLKPEFEAVMESVGPNGEFLDHFDGRILNPGHAIECAWFILHEAKHRNRDPELLNLGLTMLDWMWQRGWDEEFGGILYFRDVKNLPVQEYWQDMKFWWPHCEAIIATLLAYSLTGDEKYARWHRQIHDWTHMHFPDKEYGEWFGYLHRDGRISVTLKGNLWKGPFHIPRMQLYCWKLLEEMKVNRE